MSRHSGVRRPGGYADHIIVPHPRYLVDIEGVDPHYACTLACAGVTAFSAIKKARALAQDDKLVIIGSGGVGLTGVGIAREYISNEKIIVDIDEEKLAAAREAGADHTINPKREDAVAEVARLTTAGAGAVVDFVGSTETATFGMEVLRRGGTYILVGLYGGRIDIPTLALPTRDIGLRGSYVGNLGDARADGAGEGGQGRSHPRRLAPHVRGHRNPQGPRRRQDHRPRRGGARGGLGGFIFRHARTCCGYPR